MGQIQTYKIIDAAGKSCCLKYKKTKYYLVNFDESAKTV
jgi:hypothetical protein